MRFYVAGKLHGLRITATKPDYHGSATVDTHLLELAGMEPFERVDVCNMTTGARFTTYLLAGGPGAFELNGAAARLGQPGDRCILITYQGGDAFHGCFAIEADADNQAVKGYHYRPGGEVAEIELP